MVRRWIAIHEYNFWYVIDTKHEGACEGGKKIDFFFYRYDYKYFHIHKVCSELNA